MIINNLKNIKIFVKFNISGYLKSFVQEIHDSLNSNNNNGYFT